MIPLAADIQKSDGTFALSRATAISCADAAGCAATKAYLSGLLQKTSLPDTGGEGAVMLRHVEGLAPEAYRLQITPKGVEIAATGEAGLFYGTITLWQLASENSTIPAQNITDAPRFSWRGVLLDSVRHFQTVDEVKRFIDAMAIHKLNVLQWHLTDDQGWRIEIKKYPLLTKIAAWRKNSREGRHGGFYTQDQVRDVVAYAAARHITVVPEIEMPGHASAALAAYPKLASIKHPSRKVSGDWGIFPNLYNVDDATFAFLEDVLSEVMTLFPSPYIHVGGDEAPKGQWDASPKIQAQMKALGVPNTKELQGYFTARIGKYLDAHGRRLIGWDEILEGGPPANAAITSWRTPESAIEAAEKGHDVVFSPAPQLYLDYCQIAREGEPTCRGVQSTLKDVYAFDPEPKGALAKHLIGMQANIWTEHLPTMNAVFYAGFPRLAAVAEIAWTPREKHNWPDFLSRLPDQMRRYQALGIRYSDAAFSVNVAAKPAQSGASVTLSNQSGYGVIHYTLDGSAPTPQSPLYSAPFDTKLPATITATTFAEGKPIAPPRSESLTAQSILRRNSYTLELCGNGIPLAQKGHSGAVVMVDVMNPCWFYKGIDLSSVRGFDIAVTHLPFNFQIGDDIKHIPLDAKAAPHGQLEIRLGDCKGEKLAVVPLKANTSHLSVKITPQKGAQDLCFVFARRKVDPVWAIDWVQPLVQE
ncbi:hexosaminidase [Rhizomicrobium palustre]|uniref:beta-N-acetylhexosaminidase n=2 Tax=Rhizomicrobium palustre TaxID=189966 RepID=A0A846MW23_9PROT|nr:hexosaminidase [Rhizomicrobium palustre]